MIITKAEREFLRCHKIQIALDAKDWSGEFRITRQQLAELSSHTRSRVLTDPIQWRNDWNEDVLYNMRHPANKTRFHVGGCMCFDCMAGT